MSITYSFVEFNHGFLLMLIWGSGVGGVFGKELWMGPDMFQRPLDILLLKIVSSCIIIISILPPYLTIPFSCASFGMLDVYRKIPG